VMTAMAHLLFCFTSIYIILCSLLYILSQLSRAFNGVLQRIGDGWNKNQGDGG
jgi:TM2 domain-containing membrane protein YozV